MSMKFRRFRDCKHGKQETDNGDFVTPISYSSTDLREEYASAFRTESYHDFWARVLDLALDHGAALKPTAESMTTTAERLPSYELFIEHLLEPDQSTVTNFLANTQRICSPGTCALLNDYYSETANASFLCGILLKDIERIRHGYRPLKATLCSLVSDANSESQGLQDMNKCLDKLTKTCNPFTSLASSQCKFKVVQDGSSNLLKRLESKCRAARGKLRCLKHIKRAVIVVAVVLVASTSVIGACIATHVVLAFIFLPTLLSAQSPMAFSTRWLARAVKQLDVAAKGAYILNRDLDTISRHVARLQDEVEHMLALLRLCCDHRPHQRLASEVLRQIWKNDSSFNQQLDELEEHLYLCLMTINKVRSLVMKKVLVSVGNNAT